jgi:glycosyltransferase involved in cell wall biosynthesis
MSNPIKLVDKLDTLKIQLAIDYKDNELYEAFLKKFAEARVNFSEEKQAEYEEFLKIINCMVLDDSSSYNEIAEYFDRQNKHFLAFLCRLYSLSLTPEQEVTYSKAKQYLKKHDPFKPEKIQLRPNKCAISVIMPTYNRGEMIYDSVKSVLEQEFQDFELVIINDGGTDEVEDVLNDFKTDKIKYYKISHKGLAGALNEGLKRANGEYVAYLDDDDIYYPNHLKVLYEEMISMGCDFVFSRCYIAHGKYEGKEFQITKKQDSVVKDGYSERLLHKTPYISTLSVLHKKECLYKIGLFNEELPWAMDWFQWIKMSKYYVLHFVDIYTGEYRKNENSMTKTDVYKMDFYCKRIFELYYNSFYGHAVLAISSTAFGDKEFVPNLLKRIEFSNGYITSFRARQLIKSLYRKNYWKLICYFLRTLATILLVGKNNVKKSSILSTNRKTIQEL